jgi:hypothetical protein
MIYDVFLKFCTNTKERKKKTKKRKKEGMILKEIGKERKKEKINASK